MSADSLSRIQAARGRPTLVEPPARAMPLALPRRICEVRSAAFGAEAPRSRYERWKRVVDVVLTLLALPVVLPMIVLCALAVRRIELPMD